MEGSIEYGITAARPRRFARVTPVTEVSDGPKISFKLLILFLLMLYSSIAVAVPALNEVRPVLLVAVGGILMLVVELAQTRRSFRLSAQGFMVAAFLGVAVIASFDAIYVRRAVETTWDLSKIVLIYLVLENTITSESRLRTILFTLVIGGMFPALGTINNYMHGVLLEHTRAAWKGVFANPNEDAYSLVVLIPIAVVLASTSKWLVRIALWGFIATYLLAIFLTFSRGGLLALFAVLGLMGWKQKSYVIRGLMIVGLAVCLLLAGMYWGRSEGFRNISKDTTVNQRIATIKAGMLMFAANPLLGVGPGDSLVAYPLYVPKEAHCGCQSQLVIHNSFIQVLSELGIFGFIPFMLFLAVSLFQAWKMQPGPIGPYAAGLEVGLWGFMAASLSGGFTYSWWPYIFVGAIAAAKRISDSKAAAAA
jgi:O-antigen ligase